MALKEKGKTIIITSHILESLTGICDAISYLKNKNIQCTFEQPSFHEIEHSIFGNFNEETTRRIKDLLI